MANQLMPGQRALRAALKRFASPTPHREIKAALTELERNHARLIARVRDRAANRLADAEQRRSQFLTEAEASLVRARAEVARQRVSADKEAIKNAATLLVGAERWVGMAPDFARQKQLIAERENAIEDGLLQWIDGLVTLAVEALNDDAALAVAVVLLSEGGLLVAGVAGGPTTVGIVTAASLVLIVKSVHAKLSRVERAKHDDAVAARYERALVIIGAARDLSAEWLKRL